MADCRHELPLPTRPPTLYNLCSKRTSYSLVKGPSYAPVRRKIAADITKEMLDSGVSVALCFGKIATDCETVAYA